MRDRRRAGDPPASSRRDELDEHRRQYRPADQRHQHHLQQLGHDRRRGRRHPDLAEARSTRPTADYVKHLRESCRALFPGATFSFLPADIVSQILNFGAPAPIDVQIVGTISTRTRAYANGCWSRSRAFRASPIRASQQAFELPALSVDVDRTLAGVVGLSERDVADSLLITLAGSAQIAPTFWLNPKNGVSYPVVVQTPQYAMDTLIDARESARHRRPATAHAAAWRPGVDITPSRSDAVVIPLQCPAGRSTSTPTTQGRDLGGGRRRRPEDHRQTTAQGLPQGATVDAARPGP